MVKGQVEAEIVTGAEGTGCVIVVSVEIEANCESGRGTCYVRVLLFLASG